MSLDALLHRPGLAPGTRLLIVVAVAIWRTAWSELRSAVGAARGRGQDRRDLEETLLQCVLFCGFPRVVTAFEHLNEAWPVSSPPAGGGLPGDRQVAAGRALFATIYGRNDPAVREMLQRAHGELHDFVLEAAYGRILTRPHLDGRTREILAVALLAAQDQAPQFRGHAKGARNFGATDEELHEAVITAFGDDAAARPWTRLLGGATDGGEAQPPAPLPRGPLPRGPLPRGPLPRDPLPRGPLPRDPPLRDPPLRDPPLRDGG
jgi:4-carboxymuconolactone decarboxylase